MTRTITAASTGRIAAVVDDFIHSDYVEATRYEFPRADGSTHGEQINDWREQFQNYMADCARHGRRTGSNGTLDRLTAAVNVYWDDLEAWHAEHGSLDTPIG
jgi:hypothetical protein